MPLDLPPSHAPRCRECNALAQLIAGHASEVVARGYSRLHADDNKTAISKLPDVTAAR